MSLFTIKRFVYHKNNKSQSLWILVLFFCNKWACKLSHMMVMFMLAKSCILFIRQWAFYTWWDYTCSKMSRLTLHAAHVISRILLSLCQLSSGGRGTDNHGPSDGSRQWCQVLCKHPPVQHQNLWRCSEHSFLNILRPTGTVVSFLLLPEPGLTALHQSGTAVGGPPPASSLAGASCLLPFPVVLRVERK